MASSHEVCAFAEYSGRHANLLGLCHVRNMMSRGFEGLRRMILHMADLLVTVPEFVLSGRLRDNQWFGCIKETYK